MITETKTQELKVLSFAHATVGFLATTVLTSVLMVALSAV